MPWLEVRSQRQAPKLKQPFNHSYPEGNFGGNRLLDLLDRSISLALLYPRMTNDLHIRRVKWNYLINSPHTPESQKPQEFHFASLATNPTDLQLITHMMQRTFRLFESFCLSRKAAVKQVQHPIHRTLQTGLYIPTRLPRAAGHKQPVLAARVQERYQGVADSSLSGVQCKVVSAFCVMVVHTTQKVLDP